MATRKRTKKTPYDPSSTNRRSSRKGNSLNEDDIQPSTSGLQTSSRSSSNKKQSNKSLSSTVRVDTDMNRIESEDTPTLSQFQTLTNTVKELSDLVKSLQTNISSMNGSNSNNSSTSHDMRNTNVSNVTQSRVTHVSHDNINGSKNVDDMVPIEPLEVDTNDDQVNLTTQVDQVINEHIATIMDQDNNQPIPGNYISPDRPVDFKVADKLKQQIWNNQYVDLFSLLDPKYENSTPTGYDLVNDRSSDTFQLTPRKPVRKIQGLGQWCSSFQIYLTILCQKFPGQLPHLMTYMNTIKHLAHKNGDYIKYDEEFRYMRQHINLPWNTTHSGLWLECFSNKQQNNSKQNKQKPNFQNNTRFNPSFKKTVHPTGYCFRFHNFGKCGRDSCAFLHSCYNAQCHNALHSISKCPNKDKLSNNQASNNNKAQNQANPKTN